MKTMENNSTIHVVRDGTCPSLSGRSKLTYEVGADAATEVHVRISKNSGTGYFNRDWVAWDAIRQILTKNLGLPITLNTLTPLFKGTSANNAGFMLAVLKHEGLVRRMEDKPRYYECLGPSAFRENDRGAKASANGRQKPAKANRPGATTPAATMPVVSKALASKAAPTMPLAGKAVASKTSATTPAVTMPETSKPVAGKAVAGKPVSSTPGATTPMSTTPVPSKSPPTVPMASKPVAHKPMSTTPAKKRPSKR
jgi:hypothetical protein